MSLNKLIASISIFGVLVLLVLLFTACNESKQPLSPVNEDQETQAQNPKAKAHSYQLDAGEDYRFFLVSPANNAWFELGNKFKWTKFDGPLPPYIFYRYNVTITGNGQEYHRYTDPYDRMETQITIDQGIAQGTFYWYVIAEYTAPGYGRLSEDTWYVKIYDARIKGPSSAVPRNNQEWHVNEYSGWGPYSYQWNVYNSIGQKVVGPLTTPVLSINQIPPVAYGGYYIDLYVTFLKGTEHRTRLVTLQ